ncbi:MAG: PAS domain S-box protein, partial [Rhodospirillales bacterium]
SDLALERLVPADARSLTDAQTLKGWLFVAVTAASLYLLMSHLGRRLQRASEEAGHYRDSLADFAESASDWFWETGPDLRLRFVSDRLRELGGGDPVDFLGKAPADLFAAEEDPGVLARHLDDLAARRPFRDFVFRRRTSDGSRRYARISGRPLFGPGGAFLGYRGVGCDVTAEVETRRLRDRLAAVVEATSDFVGTADVDGRVLYINGAGRAMLGIGPDTDIGGLRIGDSLTQESKRLVREVALPATVRNGMWTGETTFVARDGREVPVWQVMLAHREPTGHVAYVSSIARDLTERRIAEAALRESERRYRAIFESSADGVMIFDSEGRLIEANPAACAMHGYARAEMIGQHGARFLDPAAQAQFPEHLKSVALGREFQAASTHLRRDGTSFPVDVHGAGFLYAGRLHGLVMVRDATERRSAEERLRRSQKLEAIGGLTGGLAHDFNNFLVVILGHADLLAERLGDSDPKAKQYIESISRAGERAADLTRRLLAVARQQPLNPEQVDLGAFIAEIEPLLRRTLGEHIEIRTAAAPGLWRVFADRSELETSILNLAINARDAMPGGGRLTIEAGPATVGAGDSPPHADLTPGDYAVLAVSDTGTGMPRDVLDRVFEPFFTTKAAGRGTGLGLSMVFGFARQSGGTVTVYSEPGAGTTFRLYLPRHRGAEEAPAPRPAAEELPRGTATILVVEDEPLVREFVADQLRRLGYVIVEAENAAAALAALDRVGQVDLMLTDVIMPGLNGPQLAAEARRRRPGLRVLYTTGYAEQATLHVAAMDGDAPILSKPYRRELLAQTVHRALDDPPA